MIKFEEKEGSELPVLFMSLTSLNCKQDVVDLRNAINDAILNIVSYQESKDAVKPYSLYLLTDMAQELTKDIENFKKEGGEA